jgi:glutamate formiminotransferase/formiminotetrahydrofolate cyclodeaminase
VAIQKRDRGLDSRARDHQRRETALRLPNAAARILEAKIRAAEVRQLWLRLRLWTRGSTTAGGSPTPGACSAAALAGALAAALVAMVARLTVGRKAYAAVDAQARGILEEAERMRVELRGCWMKTRRPTRVSRAYKIPTTPGAPSDRRGAFGGRAPAEVVKHGRRVLALADLRADRNQNAVSDARVAGMLARTAIDGATENVTPTWLGCRITPSKTGGAGWYLM